MFKSLFAALLSITVLTGCTGLPAQNLKLHPEVSASKPLPVNTRVEVRIEDTRASALVGQRIDRLKNTAPLSLTDAEESLTHAVEHALEDMGVTNFSSGGFVLTVYLDKLNYNASMEKAVVQEVAADSEIRVKVEKGNRFYTGRYTTQMTRTFVNTPTPADNEELMNALVADTLGRAFNDEKLVNFLRFK